MIYTADLERAGLSPEACAALAHRLRHQAKMLRLMADDLEAGAEPAGPAPLEMFQSQPFGPYLEDGDIATETAKPAEDLPRSLDPFVDDEEGEPALWHLAGIAREIYADRRKRQQIFGDETLFGEPAWDILLDLFIAARARRRVSVTSACIGAVVPNTTALRWVRAMEQKGMLTANTTTATPGGPS